MLSRFLLMVPSLFFQLIQWHVILCSAAFPSKWDKTCLNLSVTRSIPEFFLCIYVQYAYILFDNTMFVNHFFRPGYLLVNLDRCSWTPWKAALITNGSSRWNKANWVILRDIVCEISCNKTYTKHLFRAFGTWKRY